jgi:hypothetical protein
MRSDRLAEAALAVALLAAFVGDVRIALPIAAMALLLGAAAGRARPQALAGAAVLGAATVLMETGHEVAAWALALAVVAVAGLGATTGAPVLAGSKH